MRKFVLIERDFDYYTLTFYGADETINHYTPQGEVKISRQGTWEVLSEELCDWLNEYNAEFVVAETSYLANWITPWLGDYFYKHGHKAILTLVDIETAYDKCTVLGPSNFQSSLQLWPAYLPGCCEFEMGVYSDTYWEWLALREINYLSCGFGSMAEFVTSLGMFLEKKFPKLAFVWETYIETARIGWRVR